MAEYKGIKGFKVQYLSADPSNPIVGQIWYNSTSKALKFTEYQAAGWATAANLPTGTKETFGFGTLTAAVIANGETTVFTNLTQEYDGTTWTANPNSVPQRRSGSSAGTQTAGLAAGGYNAGSPQYDGNTFFYDGTTWTGSVATMSSLRERTSSTPSGTQTAALATGGLFGPPGSTNQVESFNGTAWTGISSMSLPAWDRSGAGTQTAYLVVGGQSFPPAAYPYSNTTEEWNGSSWTAGGTYINSMAYADAAGTQTAAINAGGNGPTPGTNTSSAIYDGTSWTSLATMVFASSSNRVSGTTAGVISAGNDNSPNVPTQEYSPAGPVTKTVTVS